MSRHGGILVALVMVVANATVGYGIPHIINYQGILRNSNGSPEVNPTNVLFAIWNHTNSGDSLWSEMRNISPDSAGLFTVLLGSTVPIPDSVFSDSAFLSIRVAGDEEMTPRTNFASVAYAYRVGTIDGASGGTINGDVTISGDLSITGVVRVTGDTIYVGTVLIPPTTRYYALPPSVFVGGPAKNAPSFQTTTEQYLSLGGTRDSVRFFAGGGSPVIHTSLRLPQGAIITRVDAYFTEIGPDPYWEIWVERKAIPPGTGSDVIGYIQRDEPIPNGVLSITSLSNNTIDNEHYYYDVAIVFEVTGGAVCYGGLVEYTIASPLP